LDDILKKCEFDKARLEAMFPKRHTPRKHVHVSHTTHAHTHQITHAHSHQAQHAHTHHAKHVTHNKHAHVLYTHHAFMYGRVYSCTYCSRKGHLAKFYFD